MTSKEIELAIHSELVSAIESTRAALAEYISADDFCIVMISACATITEKLSGGSFTIMPVTKEAKTRAIREAMSKKEEAN